MTQLFYVDGHGNYIGSFDGAEPPDGALEVGTAPQDARQVWSGTAWGPVPAPAPIPPTPRLWLERLSPETQAAITAAATRDTTGALLLWLLKAAGAQTIDVTASETIAGVAALVALGIITAADQTTLLTP